MENVKRIAQEAAYGACYGIGLFLLPILLLSLVYDWADERFELRPIDATDRSFQERSGLALRTDYGTGCQYLETSAGNLTPRLDAEGRHVCAR